MRSCTTCRSCWPPGPASASSAAPGSTPTPEPRPNKALLVLRSSKQVGKAPSAVSWRWRWPSPDPGFGVGVELGGGQLGDPGDLARIGEGLPGQGVPAEDPPPGLLQIQPAGALGNEHLLDARGWSASQPRVARLEWLDRLSVITAMTPVGLSCSSRARNCCQQALLRDGAHSVTA